MLQYKSDTDQHFKAEVVATAGGFSAPIIFPGFVDDISVVALPGISGSALVQYTVDPEEEIDMTPGGVDWIDWDAGTVTAKAGFTAKSAVTAVRIQAITADAILKVAANRRVIWR